MATRLQNLENEIETTTRWQDFGFYYICRCILALASEIGRIADAYEEAHK